MKKFLSIIAVTAVFTVLMVSCKNNNAGDQLKGVDTTGLAELQAMKAQQALAAQQPKTIVKYVPVQQQSGSMSSSSSNEGKVAEKKGWSKAAKYGVIGGGGGAVIGAVVNKRNRVAGGVIGGIVGGGLGYLIGRSKDKKEGRY